MNLLKKFVRNDNADLENDAYNDVYDIYTMPKELEAEMESADAAANVSSIDNPARKEPEIRPASPDKVALKLLQPKSHTEAVKIADKLKEGCIVLLDISHLTKDKALRLVDFLAGVAYVLGGEMIKTNKNTIVVPPAGVDISSFASEETAPEAPTQEETVEEEYVEEDVYEEAPAEKEV